MRHLPLVLGLLFFPGAVQAAVQTRIVEYKQGATVLEGYLAWDDAVSGKRPGVLLIHDWTGVGPYVEQRARQLAGMGFVAFAADIYGRGIRPATPAQAGKEAAKYKQDRPLLRARAEAGLAVLRTQERVDSRRIAAIGYCFGGTTVLELARSGADIAGVVSFHGGLDAPLPAAPQAIKAKVLVLHGGDDPFVPPAEVSAFQDEMRKSGADWQFVAYGGAVHSFTNPAAGKDPGQGAAYNESADRRSWEAMKSFFSEIFR